MGGEDFIVSSSTEYPANNERDKYEKQYLEAVMAVSMSILFSGAVPAQGSNEKRVSQNEGCPGNDLLESALKDFCCHFGFAIHAEKG
jgi:hypothetical protein